MAGKPKRGLDYFSCDVDILQDYKIKRLKRKHRSVGFSSYLTLLTMIYQNGQHLKFDDIEQVLFTVADELGDPEEEVVESFETMMKLKLFDEDMFNKGYLTSRSIQLRFLNATKRRVVRLHGESCLLTQREVFNEVSNLVYIDGNYVDINQKNAHKKQQSNSNTKRKSNRDELEIINDMRSADHSIFPFKPNYYFMVLVNNKVITGYEKFAMDFNDFLYHATKEYEKPAMRKSIYYTINQMRFRNWKDDDGDEIYDKQAYLETAIKNNAAKNETKQEKNCRMNKFQEFFHNL